MRKVLGTTALVATVVILTLALREALLYASAQFEHEDAQVE